MKKTIRAVADRCEGAFTVMIPDDGGDALRLSTADCGITEGDVADLTVEDGKVTEVTVLKDETERRLAKNRSRLSALFAKGKN